jgi:hypothetical protein
MRKQPRRRFTGWAAICMFACVPAIGQETKDDIIQKLISRVEALEREVASLKPPAAPDPVIAMPPREPVPIVAVIPADTSEPAAVSEKRYTFHAYADVGFARNEDGTSVKHFELGELDLFASVRITPKLTALAEVVFETENQTSISHVPINVDRVLLQYRPSQFFNLDIGSYRTAIGYYNTAYPRGSWFGTALTRPKLFAFEDDAGFLPLHNTGLSANGSLPSGALGLRYVVEVGNSRNFGEDIEAGFDNTQHAAFNVALTARPRGFPGFQAGFSFYRDLLSPPGGVTVDRSVWTAHGIYQANRIEFLNEVVLMKFQRTKLGWGDAPGFYSQLAYRVGSSWSPYVRFEDLNSFGRGVAGLAVQQAVPRHTSILGGLRYDVNEAVALKFELGREDYHGQPAWVRAAMQVAFSF